MSISNGAILLTDTILGYDNQDLATKLVNIAAASNLSNIAYMKFMPKTSDDLSLLSSIVTYSMNWQIRYFEKRYVLIDPVITHGMKAILPFDWASLGRDDPKIREFFEDAAKYGVGANGLSIPVRSRGGSIGIVSYNSNHSKAEWENYKKEKMSELQILSVLIDCAGSRRGFAGNSGLG